MEYDYILRGQRASEWVRENENSFQCLLTIECSKHFPTICYRWCILGDITEIIHMSVQCYETLIWSSNKISGTYHWVNPAAASFKNTLDLSNHCSSTMLIFHNYIKFDFQDISQKNTTRWCTWWSIQVSIILSNLWQILDKIKHYAPY